MYIYTDLDSQRLQPMLLFNSLSAEWSCLVCRDNPQAKVLSQYGQEMRDIGVAILVLLW